MMGSVTIELPDELKEKVAGFPEVHTGVSRVTVELRDGSTVAGVLVGWAAEIIRVEGLVGIPFSSDDIVDVRDGSGSA